MNRLSRELGKEKVLCIRPKTLHEVVTMPSRMTRAEHKSTVVQMPARTSDGHRRSQAVITMPSRERCTGQHASVVEMPSRFGDGSESMESNAADQITSQSADRRKPIVDLFSLSDGLRMTLVALFALLGWPRPTHGKDPGAAAARPFKLELLNVISRLRVPGAASAPLAAQGSVLVLPQAVREDIGADLAAAA